MSQATIGLGTPIGQVPKAVIANPTPKLVPAYSLKTPLLALAEPPPPAKEGAKIESNFFTTVITNPVQSLSKIRDSLLRTFDSPAYFNLTTDYCNNIFNPSTPDDPDVRYFSIAARAVSINPLHPLWWTKLILDHTAAAGEAEKDGFAGSKYEGSDGMVSVSSAKWGECGSPPGWVSVATADALAHDMFQSSASSTTATTGNFGQEIAFSNVSS